MYVSVSTPTDIGRSQPGMPKSAAAPAMQSRSTAATSLRRCRKAKAGTWAATRW